MPDINFEKLKDAVIEILTHHQMAVGKYGSKKVFTILKKGKSTGYNEMNPAIALERIQFLEKPGADRPSQNAKLDIVDFMLGMMITGDRTPLVIMSLFFAMASYEIPESDVSKEKIINLVQDISREHFESVNEALEAVKDRKFEYDEAVSVRKEAGDLLSAAAKLFHIADDRVNRG
ncbi:MAG: hypothetical protein MI863_20665 [Desulfobacterales bacterium]|nr:hypothetical protein [Desulfobacterales bacterium]